MTDTATPKLHDAAAALEEELTSAQSFLKVTDEAIAKTEAQLTELRTIKENTERRITTIQQACNVLRPLTRKI